jgi:hypothetical protein
MRTASRLLRAMVALVLVAFTAAVSGCTPPSSPPAGGTTPAKAKPATNQAGSTTGGASETSEP